MTTPGGPTAAGHRPGRQRVAPAIVEVRLGLLATEGPFSGAVLERLLDGGLSPVVLALAGPAPGSRGALPVEVSGAPRTLADVARGRGVPVCYWSRVGEPPSGLCEAGADFYLAAGFPFRLPVEVLDRAPLGGLNLHPSLLPRYRGPAPLFWQLRAGEGETGVTLHRMSDRLDAGAVLARTRLPLPDGAEGPVLAKMLGDAAAGLFLEGLGRLREGRLEGRAQDESRATYQPWPRPPDFTLATGWSARRAFNFIRGTEAWGYPYTVQGEGRSWRVRTALAWWPGVGPGADAAPPCAGCERLRFSPGFLDVLTV